jgi:tetratricopeptide (TPR) repeat protein
MRIRTGSVWSGTAPIPQSRRGEQALSIALQPIATRVSAKVQEEMPELEPVLTRAEQARRAGKVREAAALFEQGIELAEQAGRPDRAIRAALTCGRMLLANHDYDSGVAQILRAAELAATENDTNARLEAYSVLGNRKIAGDTIAAEYAPIAVELSRELGDAQYLGLALFNLGQVYLAQERFDEAARCVRELAGTPYFEPRIVLSLAAAMVRAGAARDALRLLDEHEEGLGATIEHVELRAEVYGALQDIEKELEQRRRIVAALRAEPPSVATVQCYCRTGFRLLQLGRVIEAVDLLEHGLGVAREVDDPAANALIWSDLGKAYHQLGNTDAALNAFAEQLQIAQSIDSSFHIAHSRFNTANVLAKAGRTTEAEPVYREAADAARKAKLLDVEGGSLDSLGTLHSIRNEAASAVEYHGRAVELHEKAGLWRSVATDLINLIGAYLQLGEVTAARDALATVDQYIRDNRYEDLAPPARQLHGMVLAAEGRWPEAKDCFYEVIAAMEKQRGAFASPVTERQWAGKNAHQLELIVEAAIKADQPVDALLFQELNKTRFLEAFSRRRLEAMSHADPEAYLEYQRYSDEIADLRRRRRQEMRLSSSELDAEIQAAEEKRRALGIELERDAGYAAEREVPGIEDLLAGLSADLAVVTISLHNSGVGVIGLVQGQDGKWTGACAFVRSLSRDRVQQLILGGTESVDQFRSPDDLLAIPPSEIGWALGMAAMNARIPGVMPLVIDEVCTFIGKELWPTIEELVDGRRDVLIVAGAGLNLLPLHAAVLAGGVRAGDKYRITYAPSLDMHRRVRDVSPRAELENVGQAADPSGDLRFARAEASAVAASFTGLNIATLRGAAAKKDAVLAQLHEADIFHFAGHGAFDAHDPLDSRIVCADGNLTLRMLLSQTRPIRVRFAILSACESGVSEITDVSNDSLNLPGACLAMGIPTVLATFWSVNDLATFFLIDRCMQLWADGNTLSQALARSQAWMRDEATYQALQLRVFELMDQLPEEREQFLAVYTELKKYRTERRLFSNPVYWAAFHVCGPDIPPNGEQGAASSGSGAE